MESTESIDLLTTNKKFDGPLTDSNVTDRANNTNIANTISKIDNAETLNTKSPLESNKITKKYILDTLYLLSHIAFASILVVCLKKINPLLLAVLLFAMLGYISYDEQRTMPIYTLVAVGTAMYCVDLFIVGDPKESLKKKSTLRTLKDSIWKLPYYGIISYYVILYVLYCFNKDIIQ